MNHRGTGRRNRIVTWKNGKKKEEEEEEEEKRKKEREMDKEKN